MYVQCKPSTMLNVGECEICLWWYALCAHIYLCIVNYMVVVKPVGFTGPQVTGDHDCVQFIHTLIGSEFQFCCGVNMSNTQVNQFSRILLKVASLCQCSCSLPIWLCQGQPQFEFGIFILVYIDPVLFLGLFLDFFFSLSRISVGQIRSRV